MFLLAAATSALIFWIWIAGRLREIRRNQDELIARVDFLQRSVHGLANALAKRQEDLKVAVRRLENHFGTRD